MTYVDPIDSLSTLAHAYHDHGWLPFGLPFDRKAPPRAGYTGHTRPDYPDIVRRDITNLRTTQNLGVALDLGTIGIDIDTYMKGDTTKRGGDEITTHEEVLGPLPPTWHSTRRGPQATTGPTRSGIYMYRLPDWALADDTHPRCRTNPFPSVEIIQFHHRYAVVYPSVVDGLQYRWYRPDGTTSPSLLPPPQQELPILPDAWAHELLEPQEPRLRTLETTETGASKGIACATQDHALIIGHPRTLPVKTGTHTHRGSVTTADEWCTANIPGWTDEPNRFMLDQLDRQRAMLYSGHGRHDTLRNGTWHLMCLSIGDDGHPGNPGGQQVTADLARELMTIRTSEGEDRRSAIGECERILSGAVEKLRAEVESGARSIHTGWHGQSTNGSGLWVHTGDADTDPDGFDPDEWRDVTREWLETHGWVDDTPAQDTVQAWRDVTSEWLEAYRG